VPVVDASVWVSLCHAGDRHHAGCSRWLESVLVAGGDLVAPTLLQVEVAAAIRRLTGDEELALSAVATTAESNVLRLESLTDRRSRHAAEIARLTAVRGADAVYLQLAAERGEVLVTLDRQQLERGSTVARVERP
jgi:predicted nucleic acid-binding protein